MASHESYYTSSSPLPSVHSSTSAPPPPPKPSASTEPGQGFRPIGPSQAYTSQTTSSPRPPPPLPLPSDQPSFPQATQPAIPQIPPPTLSDHWLPNPPDLTSYSTADLLPILQNPSLLTALASQHPSHTSSLSTLQSALSSNTALVTQLSTLESQITSLRDQTAQLLLQHQSLQTQWRRKQSEMDDALSPWGGRAMYQRLVSGISEQEQLVRAMVESFLEGQDGVDGSGGGKASDREVGEWVKRVREGTALLEKRREMRARWDEGRVGGWR